MDTLPHRGRGYWTKPGIAETTVVYGGPGGTKLAGRAHRLLSGKWVAYRATGARLGRFATMDEAGQALVAALEEA